MDVVQHINIQRLRRLGHVIRMKEDTPARWVFDARIAEVDVEQVRWKDQIEVALSSISVINWRRRARCRGAKRNVLRQTEIR